ncbi:MAG: MFS transporter [Thermomicrobiales bacterium]
MKDDTAPQSSRANLLLLCVAFSAFGIMFGIWQVVLEDLRQALSISEGPLGLAYTIAVFGSLPAMIVAGRFVDRVGAKRLAVGALAGMACVFVILTGVSSYLGLVAILFVFLAATGTYDVGINAAAIHHERRTSRPVMPLVHGAFSAGGATGAIIAGLLLSQGAPFRSLYLVVAGLLGLVAVFLGLRARWHGVKPAGKSAMKPTSMFRRTDILILALIVSLAFLAEGAMETWSAIYLRSSMNLPALIGASGVAIFHLAMAIGRLSTSVVIHRLGRRGTMGVAGVLAAIGNVMALATPNPTMILTGFLVVGLALAGIAPVALSLGGDIVPDRAGEATSILMTVGYTGFSLGPTIIGFLAEATSLRLALGVIGTVSLGIAYLATRVAPDSVADPAPVPEAV